jgi:hypothetical protein
MRSGRRVQGGCMNDWIKEAPIAVTVCDGKGIITEMNLKAGNTFAKNGGLALIGSDLLACHPEPSNTKLKNMLSAPPAAPNAYTVEKNGVKKLIYQFARRENGRSAGLVELSLEIPRDMPHFVRK